MNEIVIILALLTFNEQDFEVSRGNILKEREKGTVQFSLQLLALAGLSFSNINSTRLGLICLYIRHTINLISAHTTLLTNPHLYEICSLLPSWCFPYLPTNPSHVSPGLPVSHSYMYPPQEQHRPHDSLSLSSSSFSSLPPLHCSDSHWSASQPQPCWSVSARSHDHWVQAQGSRCGRRANGNAEVIWVELIALFYSPAEQCKPPPSLSDSLYLSLVGFFQNQQKCTDGQRLQTWMHGQIKLSCFVVKAC